MVLELRRWRYCTYVWEEHFSNLKLSLQTIVLPNTRPLGFSTAGVLSANSLGSSNHGNSSCESPGTKLYQ
jgi:hypothetical protein